MSGFWPAILNPMIDTRDDPASERLLNASAVIAIEPLITPTKYLKENSKIFKNMPNTPHTIP